MAIFDAESVLFLNPRTCGIYKNGGVRYKVNADGRRSTDVDNELLEQVQALLAGGGLPAGAVRVSQERVQARRVLVPRYFDQRWEQEMDDLLRSEGLESVTIGDLEDQGKILVRQGHGSPSSDVRVGAVPYIKVSDIRALRVNVNPTNLVPQAVAKRFWGGEHSGLHGWDLITPN